ncbi:MAG TPA: isocitrate/isopropylmalate dehydrogenase family protein [Chloroflexi bacterium]|jgi:homoisocitrate dehydrogenase|nr:isocitrate/isopropylmalate dehydrogenase family protein [Chloroflexota bacterium]
MSYRICLIPGDGIGREVVPAGRRLLEATGLPIEFVEAEAGWETFQRLGTALPDETLAASRSADATLFGAVSSPSHPVEGYRSPIVALRRALDLYANLRPVMSQPIEGSRPNIDMLIVRENSEGLYSGRERTEEGEAVTERVITRCGSARIVRLACRLAMSRRRRVTVVHKANVLRATCGLFRTVALEVAAEHSDVQVDELLVDTAAMRLITSPETFDVLVTTNLFGDILSDEAAALVGGLGLAPSGNIGEDTALFEPVHGSAPDIAGRGIANPAATFLAVAMMLDHLGQNEIASRVRTRVEATLREGILTPDLGGTATTEEVTRAVVDALGDEPN